MNKFSILKSFKISIILLFGSIFISGISFAQSPSITDIVPNTALQGETVDVVIMGQNTSFLVGTNTQVWLSNNSGYYISPNYITVNSNTQITANFTFSYGDPAGYFNVHAYDNTNGTLTKTDGFYLKVNPNPPSIISVSPDTAMQGQVLEVVITGQNTNFLQGTSTTQAWLSNGNYYISPNYITVNSDTQITANFTFSYGDPAGDYNVYAYDDADGTLTKANGFYLQVNPNPPVLTTVSPDTATQGQTLDVVITGQNTNFTQGTNTIQVWLSGDFSYIYPNSVTVNSDTQITANFSFSNFDAVGDYDVNTYDDLNGTLTVYSGFYLGANPNPPALISVSPDSASQGETVTVLVNAQNSLFDQDDYIYVWLSQGGTNDIFSSTVIVNNSSQLAVTFQVPTTAVKGDYDVLVYGELTGYVSLPGSFEISALTTNVAGIDAIHESVTVSPNPFKDQLKIAYHLESESKVQVEMYDVSGRLVQTLKDAKQLERDNQIVVDFSDKKIPSGLYFVKVKIDDKARTFKIVKSE